MADNPELSDAGRQLATLALDKLRQEGTLGVRQRELLRRALTTTGDAFEWNRLQGSETVRANAAAKDVAALADFGADLLEKALTEELATKKAEVQQIKKIQASIQKLAKDSRATYPAEFVYQHSARDGSGGTVTKTVTLTPNNAEEALAAVATLEKRMEDFAKLRDQMLVQLENRRRLVREMKKGLANFVTAAHGLVLDVLSTPS
jgi:hypothetical protein